MDFACVCGKEYTRRSSLNRHKVKCAFGYYTYNHSKRKLKTNNFSDSESSQLQNDDADVEEQKILSKKQPKIVDDNDSQFSSNEEASSESSQLESDIDQPQQSESSEESEILFEEALSVEESDGGVEVEEDNSSNGDSDTEHKIESDVSDSEEKKSHHYPFPNMETALIYLWAHVHPRLSKRKIQGLLEVLHTPGFKLANVPKSTHHLQKYKKRLPLIKTSAFI